ncbi:MAG: ClpXP protease specificity-enhancing factor [Rhodocyclaceae bacterium]
MDSIRPYLLRAVYEWCVDQGFTPYISVRVDERTRVPRAHVHEGQIVLNIGAEAAHELSMGNEVIRFAARFGGVAHSLSIPVDRVAAIYARENGQGMAFDVPESGPGAARPPAEAGGEASGDEPQPPRPHLVRIK